MNTARLDSRLLHIDWLCVRRNFYWLCAVLFAFAAGGWIASIRAEEQRKPYLERSTTRLENLGANPETTIRCLRRRGDKAEDVANLAVESAVTENEMILPDLASIPDCPAPKK